MISNLKYNFSIRDTCRPRQNWTSDAVLELKIGNVKQPWREGSSLYSIFALTAMSEYKIKL
jgi:hypothetical protein